MYQADSCQSCGSTNLSFRWAVLSPFLASYAVRERPFCCKLLECADCGLRFFDVRLTPEEVERLYSGYRGENYFQERHRHEFWYSRAVNEGIGGDPEQVATRIRTLEDFLDANIDRDQVRTVLDYGGDRGQFIPPSLGDEKFVFELSDARPVPGVKRINSETELESRKYDLVMLFGVLEHCSDPSVILAKLKRLMSPGGILCVGVPHERYGTNFVSNSTFYRAYLNTLIKFPFLLKAVDFYSAIGRIRLNRIPPLGFVKCHEHLNFFDEKSLRALLSRSGFKTFGTKLETVVKYPSKSETITGVARLETSSLATESFQRAHSA